MLLVIPEALKELYQTVAKQIICLAWWTNCVITNSTGLGTFGITDTKVPIPLVTLSTQDNIKLLQQLKSGFKQIGYWNKYQPKVITEAQKQCFD